MADINLFNKGKRTIIGDGYEFKPESPMSFSPEEATKLKRLYPGEILGMEDVQKQFGTTGVTIPKAEVEAAIAAAVESALTAERAKVAAEQEATAKKK